jgi:hypothetical protein
MAVFIAYPSSNMINNSPLVVASAQRFQNPSLAFQRGWLENVDGQRIPFSPCLGLCNLNGVQAVIGGPRGSGGATHLGSVVSAPQVVVPCW